MATNIFHSSISKSPLSTAVNPTTPSPAKNLLTHRHRHRHLSLRFKPPKSTNSDDAPPPPVPPQITPPDAVQIRFKRGSRRISRQRENSGGDAREMKAEKQVPKSWEEMSMTEKAIELYVGEKGLLFWLNKFAYASIFIIIGVWILFRFVGPALNLYQLDSKPLSPSSLFKA